MALARASRFDSNSVFSRDRILKEVSELNGIVRIINGSVCNSFEC